MQNKTLEDYRKEIDKIDEELLHVLAKRFDVIRQIGKLKKENNIVPLDEKRWNEVIEKITGKAKHLNLSENFMKTIYEEIHKASLALERDHE
ncbi:MAG TPA: chorismate mutase [Candidatus Saccharimonadales bacterium]|nr:chorismate mutase [Candidatus Saccharimonadales bacterium]